MLNRITISHQWLKESSNNGRQITFPASKIYNAFLTFFNWKLFNTFVPFFLHEIYQIHADRNVEDLKKYPLSWNNLIYLCFVESIVAQHCMGKILRCIFKIMWGLDIFYKRTFAMIDNRNDSIIFQFVVRGPIPFFYLFIMWHAAMMVRTESVTCV